MARNGSGFAFPLCCKKKQPPLLSAVIASPLICIPFNREGQRVSIADANNVSMQIRPEHDSSGVL